MLNYQRVKMKPTFLQSQYLSVNTLHTWIRMEGK